MSVRTTHAYAVDPGEGGDSVLAETLVALAEHVAHSLDCFECCIYDYDAERNALRCQAIWSMELTDRDREWVGRDNNLTGLPGFRRVIEERRAMVAYPDDGHDRAMQGQETMAYWGELASVYAPIVRGDTVLGVLELTEKRRRREFGAADIELVRHVAALAALALDLARDSRQAKVRNEQLTALIDSAKAMTSTLDLEEVLEVVCRCTADALGVTSSYIYEYDPADRTMIWLAHFQRDPSHGFEEPIGSVYPIDDLPQDKLVVETRRPAQVSLDDPDLDPVVREQLLDWDEGSSLMVPLVIGDHVVGALEASEARDTRRFTDEEVELCVALGEQAAVAIHNAQLYRRLKEQKRIIEHQATTDGLTGLANHKAFFSRLRGEAARARRYGFSLSVLLLDLDDFKTVNDRFGHPAGDRVLKAVAHVLRTQLRKDVDLPARYGGEEFAAVLPHTGAGVDGGSLADAADGALATAERVRAAIAGVRLSGPRAPGHVTASVGIATMPAHAANADDLVSKADQALYAAKRAGKDRVEIWTGRG